MNSGNTATATDGSSDGDEKPSKNKDYESVKKYFNHIQNAVNKQNEPEFIESEASTNEEDVGIELDSTVINEDENKGKKDKNKPMDARNHPFMIFLEKLLTTNPKINKKLIGDAASFWKCKMEHVQALIKETREIAVHNHKHAKQDPTPIQSPPTKKNENEDEQEPENEEKHDENEEETHDHESIANWVETQATFYDGMFDDVDTKQLREIQARFNNHDKQNTQSCVIM